MPTLYQVINWDSSFEGAKSKTYNNKTSCQMPTKHGLGYRRLIKSKDGAALFGAWCALIQVLSRHPIKREGYCTDTGRIDGNPYTPSDLELLTDIPEKYFESLLQVVSSKEVAWVRIPDGYHKDSKYPLHSDSDSDSDLNSDGKSSIVSFSYSSLLSASLIPEGLAGERFGTAWDLWVAHRKEKKKPLTATSVKMQIKELEKMGKCNAIAAIEHSIAKGWQGIFPADQSRQQANQKSNI
jgi:hypothetical protein